MSILTRAVVAGTLALAAPGTAAHPPDGETDVIVAALQAEARFVLKGIPSEAQPVVCLAIDPGGARQSASRELAGRLRRAARRVVRGAECELREGGMVEIATGAPAILLAAGPVEWVAHDEARVPVVKMESPSRSWRREYRVVREAERWVSLGPVLKL